MRNGIQAGHSWVESSIFSKGFSSSAVPFFLNSRSKNKHIYFSNANAELVASHVAAMHITRQS